VDVGLLPAALKAAIAATAIRAAIKPYSIAVAPEMNTAEYYRERAVACEKIAAAATSDEHRQRTLEMARVMARASRYTARGCW
jgi:hypothetical protein